MLTFQALLLAGYAYTYGRHRWLPRRARVAVHLSLLAVPLATLWFFTRAETRQADAGSDDPTRAILILLATAIGVPYL